MQLVRNICTNPEVRVTKENRAAGVLDNFAEGEKYAEHALRKFVRNKSPEIMPTIRHLPHDKQHLENRVTKENRAAGVLDNFAEGEKYAEHALRKFVRNKSPEIMPTINSFFTDPKY